MGQFTLRQKNYDMHASCSRVEETFVACARTFDVYLFVLSIIYGPMSCDIQIEKKKYRKKCAAHTTLRSMVTGWCEQTESRLILIVLSSNHTFYFYWMNKHNRSRRRSMFNVYISISMCRVRPLKRSAVEGVNGILCYVLCPTIISVLLTPKITFYHYYFFRHFLWHVNYDVLLTQYACVCSSVVIRAILLLEQFID